MVSIKLDWFEFKEIKQQFKFSVSQTTAENITKFTEDLELWSDLAQSSN